jgi:hypothetical protein
VEQSPPGPSALVDMMGRSLFLFCFITFSCLIRLYMNIANGKKVKKMLVWKIKLIFTSILGSRGEDFSFQINYKIELFAS